MSLILKRKKFIKDILLSPKDNKTRTYKIPSIVNIFHIRTPNKHKKLFSYESTNISHFMSEETLTTQSKKKFVSELLLKDTDEQKLFSSRLNFNNKAKVKKPFLSYRKNKLSLPRIVSNSSLITSNHTSKISEQNEKTAKMYVKKEITDNMRRIVEAKKELKNLRKKMLMNYNYIGKYLQDKQYE